MERSILSIYRLKLVRGMPWMTVDFGSLQTRYYTYMRALVVVRARQVGMLVTLYCTARMCM